MTTENQVETFRVKPLEWALFWNQEKGHREYAVHPFGHTYHVSNEGWWFPLDVLHPCDGIEAAKAAAQADYDRRIRAAVKSVDVVGIIQQFHDVVHNGTIRHRSVKEEKQALLRDVIRAIEKAATSEELPHDPV